MDTNKQEDIKRLQTIEAIKGILRKDKSAIRKIKREVMINYPEIALEMVKIDAMNIRYVPEEVIIDNPEIALEAAKNNGEKIKNILPEKAIGNFGDPLVRQMEKYEYKILERIPKEAIIKNPEIALEIFNVSKNVFLSEIYNGRIPEEAIIKNPEIAIKAVEQDGHCIDYIPKAVIDKNPQIAIEALEDCGWAIEYIPEELINEEIIIKAIKTSGDGLNYVSTDREDYLEIALEAVKKNGMAIQYIPKNIIIEHPELAMEAVENGEWDDENIMKYVPREVENYEEIALAAVMSNSLEFEYIPTDLNNYPQIALEAVKSNEYNIYFVPTELENYPELLVEAIKGNSDVLEGVSGKIQNEMLKYPEVIMSAVKCDGTNLAYIPKEMENYQQIALEAVKNNGMAIQYVPEEILLENPEIALEAAKNFKHAVDYIPEKVMSEKPEVLMEILASDIWEDIDFTKEVIGCLEKNPQLIEEAVRTNMSIANALPQNLFEEAHVSDILDKIIEEKEEKEYEEPLMEISDEEYGNELRKRMEESKNLDEKIGQAQELLSEFGKQDPEQEGKKAPDGEEQGNN